MEENDRRSRRVRLSVLLVITAVLLAATLVDGARPGRAESEPWLDADPGIGVLPLPASALRWPSPRPVRHPAEFEPQRALVLSGTDAADPSSEFLLAIVRAAAPDVGVILLVDDVEQEESLRARLADNGMGSSRIVTLRIEHDTRWIRDYGPICVERAGADCVLLDFLYDRADDAPNDVRENDEVVPAALGALFGRPALSLPLALDGGNFLSNGDGFGVTTTDTLRENAALGIHPVTVDRALTRAFGLRSVAFLEVLVGEPTRHVDMFMTFTAPNVAVVAAIDPAADPVNAAILNRNAAILRRVKTRLGPMQVHRVPMPLRTQGKWRSYTNVLYVNGTLLVPSYRDVPLEVESAAVDVFRKALPDWHIERIDCTDVIEDEGALHCLAFNIPRCMPWSFWAPVFERRSAPDASRHPDR